MEWIKIEEKLPQDEEWIFAWFIAPTGNGKPILAQYILGGFFVNDHRLNVTHWIRPKAPTK